MKIKWNTRVQKSLGNLFKTLLVSHIKATKYEENIRNHFEHRKKKKESREGTFTNKIKNPWVLQGSVMGHQGEEKVTWELQNNKYYNNNEMVEEVGGTQYQQLGERGELVHIIHTSAATTRI